MAESPQFNFLSASEARDKYVPLESSTLSLRLSRGQITLSRQATQDLGITDKERSKYLEIQIDPTNFAVCLIPRSRPEEGYTFSLPAKVGKGQAQATVPNYVRRAGMPRGVYHQLPEKKNVFVYRPTPGLEDDFDKPTPAPHPVTPPIKRYDINGLQPGDIVGWRSSAYGDRVPIPVDGEVREIITRLRQDGKEYLAARVFVSENAARAAGYKNKIVTVNLEKLTILKKGNN